MQRQGLKVPDCFLCQRHEMEGRGDGNGFCLDHVSAVRMSIILIVARLRDGFDAGMMR